MRTLRLGQGALLLAGLVSGCFGADHLDIPGAGTRRGALQNGQPFGGELMAVAGFNMRYGPGRGGCTATLIGPRTAITAAHCVRDLALGCRNAAGLQGVLLFNDSNGLPHFDNNDLPLNGSVDAVPVVGAVAHPDAYYRNSDCTSIVPPPGDPCDLGRFDCTRVLDCADGDKQYATTDTMNSLYDVALLFLEREPVVDGKSIKPMKVIVNQQVTPELDYLVPYSGSMSLLDWVSGASPPTVMLVGYGVGSIGRDVGLALWYGGTGAGRSVINCTGATWESTGDVVTTYARDVTVEELAHNAVGEPIPLDPGVHAPGGGTDVWGWVGDSGGPVIAGPVQGPTGSPSALPAPMPADTWGIVGILSRGGGYDDPAPDGGRRPGSFHTATFSLPVSQWLVQQLSDADGDAIPDAFDNCLEHPNPDQYDPDGDGVGGLCDLCPCDSGEINPYKIQGASDGDGLCGRCDINQPSDPQGLCAAQLCPNMPIDHCPSVNDPVQMNCNADAEFSMGARVLPDICDPVPCPRFDSQEKSLTTTQTIPIGGAAKGYTGYLYLESSSTGKLELAPLGAHFSPAKTVAKITDPAKVPEFAVDVDSTEYRYCVSIAGIGLDCSALVHINDDKLRQDEGRDDELETSVWHRIWVVGPGIPKPSSSVDGQNPLDLQLNPYVTGTTAERTWKWEDDFSYWSTTSQWKSYVPYGVPSQPGQGKGRLWVHANTTHGMDLADADHGIHGTAGDDTVPQPGLANAFQDVSPITTKSRYVIHKLLT
ncbi:MAG TPA: hypothetical protein PLI95_23175, partial [Polyangiaceae bacterium]|nr:hypothetical protein [Polyangiaceae bacterium]